MTPGLGIMTEEEQALLDAYNLSGWRLVTITIGDRTAVYLAPPGDKPIDDLTIGELRPCPWLVSRMQIEEIGKG